MRRPGSTPVFHSSPGVAQRIALLAACGLLFLVPGCNWISAINYYFQPPRKQPAEFKLTKDRIAIFFDQARNVPEPTPGFERAAYDKVVELFRNQDVNDH